MHVAEISGLFTYLRTSLSFTQVAVDDMAYIDKIKNGAVSNDIVSEDDNFARRVYITSSVRQRLHQRGFRERVLAAYKDQCALCRLRHRELLDAAHIIPDNEPGGDPIVKNGISLCKLHHAAFDKLFLGTPVDTDSISSILRNPRSRQSYISYKKASHNILITHLLLVIVSELPPNLDR